MKTLKTIGFSLFVFLLMTGFVYAENNAYSSYGKSIVSGNWSIANTVTLDTYTTNFNSTWTTGADITSGGSYGIYGRANIYHSIQNANAIQGKVVFVGLGAAEALNQARAIDGYVYADDAQEVTVTDDLSAISAGVGPSGTTADILGASGDANLNGLKIIWELEGNKSITTNGVYLLNQATSTAPYMDYGIHIANQGVTTSNILLENQDKVNTSVTNDIAMTSVTGDVVNGINMSGAVYSGSDIIGQNSETIDNKTNGTWDFGAANVTTTGIVTATSGQIKNTTTISTDTYDLLVSDYILNCDYTGTAAITSLTLPTAQMVDGRIIHVVDTGGGAATKNITIDTEGAEKISGEDTKVISAAYGSLSIYSNGTHWYIF